MIEPPPHAASVCAILRQQSGAPSVLGGVLADIDWNATLAFANEEFVTTELYATLESAGHIHRLPADVRDYLAYLHDLNRVRNERMRRQLVDIVGAWNRVDIVPAVLKSGADLFNAGASATASMITDLDFLIRATEVERAVDAAETLGYRRPPDRGAGEHAYTYLVRSGEPASLDLHSELLLPTRLLPAHAVLGRAVLVRRDEVEALMLSAEDQLMHRVLHDMVHHGGHLAGTISLRGLTNFARTIRARPTIDWAWIRSELESNGAHNVLRAQAYAARKLLGADVPPDVASGLAGRLYYQRAIARWRRNPTASSSRLVRFLLKGLAYNFDPAARMMPLPVKIIRRFVHGPEPIPSARS